MQRLMKHLIVPFIVLAVFFTSCKAKEISTQQTDKSVQINNTALSSGYVSHKYRETGCKTVIIVSSTDEPLVLIPSQDLPDKFDKDGLKILFNYRPLRIKNPAGCSVGIPAELSDISIK